MERYIYLKIDNESVFLNKIKGANIKKYYKINENNIVFKILSKINMLNLIYGQWKKDISSYKYVILGDNNYNIKQISKYIKKKNTNCKIIMYFWNAINEYNRNILEDKNIDEFWTFNTEDVKKYNMKFNPQFYTKNIKLENTNIKYDILFLGAAKNRKEYIMDINKKMKNININFKNVIVERNKDYVPYEKYLNMVSATKSILDVVDGTQTGLTLRCMESIFFNKKLITNNKDIEKYDFYNPKNIFILEKDNLDNIKQFINSPYEEIDKNIVNYYDFQEWIKRFGV